MIKIQRKFSIRVSAELAKNQNSYFYVDKSYPVVAVDDNDDGSCYVLVADNKGKFFWVDLEDCLLASVDD